MIFSVPGVCSTGVLTKDNPSSSWPFAWNTKAAFASLILSKHIVTFYSSYTLIISVLLPNFGSLLYSFRSNVMFSWGSVPFSPGSPNLSVSRVPAHPKEGSHSPTRTVCPYTSSGLSLCGPWTERCECCISNKISSISHTRPTIFLGSIGSSFWLLHSASSLLASAQHFPFTLLAAVLHHCSSFSLISNCFPAHNRNVSKYVILLFFLLNSFQLSFNSSLRGYASFRI